MHTIYEFLFYLFVIISLFVLNTVLEVKSNSKRISDVIIYLQLVHLFLNTILSYWLSIVFPLLIILMLNTLLEMNKSLSIKQIQCTITIIHGLLIIFCGSYTVINDSIPYITYCIIGFSKFYLLYDSIVSYTSNTNKLFDYRLIMTIHHLFTMVAIEYILNFDEYGKIILIAYAAIEFSNIPHWYCYFAVNSIIKKKIPLYIKLMDIFMFFVGRTIIAYYIMINNYTKIDVHIINVIFLLVSWIWGYNLLLLCVIEERFFKS